jgi:hypothetical protein
VLLLAVLLTLLDLGPHAVGVRMQGATTVWYPAQNGGEIVRFRDYVPRLDDADTYLHSLKVSDAAIVALFDTRMAARRDASPRRGRFPVVLIEGPAADHAVMGELLASHGFVVATDRKAAANLPNADRSRMSTIRLDDQLTTWRLAIKPAPDSARRAAQRVLESLKRRQ